MPRRQAKWESYYTQVEEIIRTGRFINGVNISPHKLPSPQTTRQELDKVFEICSNRDFRVILVEDYEDYKVFIQIPAGKTECDFYVWYAKLDSGKLVEVKVPSHDDLATWYNRLKSLACELDEYLINAVLRLVRDREAVKDIMEKYFKGLKNEHKLDVAKFLSTLKWISLQEDTNYPPPKMIGSKYTLALYALLEAGFNKSEIRRIIKF